MPLKRFVTVILVASTVGFGFLKQVKTVYRSWPVFSAPHEEAGSVFRDLKKAAVRGSPSVLLGPAAVFVCDRTMISGPRDCGELFSDAQYGWAPDLLSKSVESHSRLFLLDFGKDDLLERYCRERGLELVAHEKGYGLAVRR